MEFSIECGSSVHYSLIYLEYIEISCIFASEIKPYLYAKECENEKQDGHLPNEHRNRPSVHSVHDLELLKAVCHSELGEYTSSDAHLERAHRMCPNRFQPLYQQVLNLKEQQKTSDAKKLAREILHKKVKVLSPEVRQIRNEMRELLKER